AFLDWDAQRGLRLGAGNSEGGAGVAPGSAYRLSSESPAIGAASDGSDLGAFVFQGARPSSAPPQPETTVPRPLNAPRAAGTRSSRPAKKAKKKIGRK